MSKKPTIIFEIICDACHARDHWGLEQAVRALIRSGKLSADADFDAELLAELFSLQANHVPCPICCRTAVLTVRRSVPQNLEWDDVVRCTDCNTPIPEARLRAIPGVTRCRDCQEEAEKY